MKDQILLKSESARHAADSLGLSVKVIDLGPDVESSISLDGCELLSDVINTYENALNASYDVSYESENAVKAADKRIKELEAENSKLQRELKQSQGENRTLTKSIRQLESTDTCRIRLSSLDQAKEDLIHAMLSITDRFDQSRVYHEQLKYVSASTASKGVDFFLTSCPQDPNLSRQARITF